MSDDEIIKVLIKQSRPGAPAEEEGWSIAVRFPAWPLPGWFSFVDQESIELEIRHKYSLWQGIIKSRIKFKYFRRASERERRKKWPEKPTGQDPQVRCWFSIGAARIFGIHRFLSVLITSIYGLLWHRRYLLGSNWSIDTLGGSGRRS